MQLLLEAPLEAPTLSPRRASNRSSLGVSMWSNLVAPIRNFLGAMQPLPLAPVGAPIRSKLEGSSSWELLWELKVAPTKLLQEQHVDIKSMCCTSNIIFCDICCFRSASWRMSSLKGVVIFLTIITIKGSLLSSIPIVKAF